MNKENEHIETQIGILLINIHRAMNKVGTNKHLAVDVARACKYAQNVENRVWVMEHLKDLGRSVAAAI